MKAHVVLDDSNTFIPSEQHEINNGIIQSILHHPCRSGGRHAGIPLWERGGVAAAAQSRNLYIAKKSVGYRPPPGVVGDVHQAGPMASRGVGDKGGRLFFGESGGQGHGSLKQWSRIFSF